MEGDCCWTWREIVHRYGRATALRLMDFHYCHDDAGWPVWLDKDIADALGMIAIEDDRGRP
jgi:hypothetical protein